MKLIPITERPDHHSLLWTLLLEREEWMSISHRVMPSWDSHVAFVDSNPYEAWYFITQDFEVVGSAYLTRHNEIGIHLFKRFRGERLGPKAVAVLMARHGSRRYLANVAPDNAGSAVMFQNLGFKLVQRTYALESA